MRIYKEQESNLILPEYDDDDDDDEMFVIRERLYAHPVYLVSYRLGQCELLLTVLLKDAISSLDYVQSVTNE